MVYLVIMVLVAVLGIVRLWLQQRREQSQMDTIDGFWSALEAMKPERAAPRPLRRSGSQARTRRATRRRSRGPGASLLSWFVARPAVDRARRVEARDKIQARRAARAAAQAEARRRYRPPAPRQRDIAYETIDLTDNGARPSHERRAAPRRRVPVTAAQTSYAARYRSNFD